MKRKHRVRLSLSPTQARVLSEAVTTTLLRHEQDSHSHLGYGQLDTLRNLNTRLLHLVTRLDATSPYQQMELLLPNAPASILIPASES